MSFLIKDKDNLFIVSFCSLSKEKLVILATDSKQFYFEEIENQGVISRISVSFPN